ncbi:hypothetical protein G9A89_014856 [Geosiphon pyriformis]|nr:hypothetical protein G9A89_014856 [Geosiphon pyriformis]
MAKTINFLFVSANLVNAVVDHVVYDVGEFFNTNHQAVFVLVDLSGLLDVQLNSLCKQANKDCWKFDFKSADDNRWENFRNAILTNAEMFFDKFTTAVKFSDLDAMWDVLHRIVVLSANKIFRKKWFKDFDSVFTKVFSKFHRLEFLVLKIVKVSCEGNDFINSGATSSHVYSVLSGMKKSYYASKLAESLATKETNIRVAINKRIKGFKINKDHTIRSVLECSFRKVVLDHLVVKNKLILKPNLVKSKINIIIEGWTRKCNMVVDVTDVWSYQYRPLDYVFDEVFSGVMCSVELNELLNVISDLLNGKAAGLLGITNKLWKHCDRCIEKGLRTLVGFAGYAEDIQFSWLRTFQEKFGQDQDVWQVITDFELTDGYCVHNGLDQREVFFFLLWHIFYDPLLCEVKRQKSICGYKLSSHFISRNGHAESQAGLSFFFAAGAFAATQHILDVVSEFFQINNISINNDKTVAISINCRVSISSLFISGLLISIAKKGESHQYLSIFLSTKGLSKPSLAKANSDICFFTNLVLKKAVSDKQFLYLVSAVLHFIVSYRTQFSFVPISTCNKWDVLIHRRLKFKSSLLFDFLSDTILHSSFYGLKSFFQVQSESKIASLVSFANSGSILGCLFFYRSHDSQVLCWCPVHSLSFPVRIHVSFSNNFLAGMVALWPISFSFVVEFLCLLFWYGVVFVDQLHDHYGSVFDWHTFKHWKRLDPCGPVFEWFRLAVVFFDSRGFFFTYPSVLDGIGFLNILESSDFVFVCNCFLQVGADSLSVYTDGSLSNLGTVGCRAGTTAFFEDIDLGLDINVSGLMSFTLVELQAIALALKCVLLLSSVKLFSDSQSALDACKSELGLACSNFHNQCWVKCYYIVNVIHYKNLKVSWHKVKDHSGISENEHADVIAGDTSLSGWYFPYHLGKCFIVADSSVVSGNFRHFVGFGSKFLAGDLLSEVDWLHSFLVWHSNLHMAVGFTSRLSANAHSYFIKTLHHQLSVAIQKHLYNRLYSSMLCLYCGDVEALDHLLEFYVDSWKAISDFFHSSLGILQMLSSCISDSSLAMALYKGFIFNNWFCKVVSIFYDPKVAGLEIVKFVCSLSLNFRSNVWSVRAKHYVYMEKNVLISLDGLVLVLVFGLAFGLSAGVVKLLGIVDAFNVCFGFCKLCLFFSGVGDSVSVYIAA